MSNKKSRSRFILILAVVLALTATVMVGCGAEANAKTGGIKLKVNPEVLVNYDKDGLVTTVEGVNQDGKKLLERYGGYKGKTAEEITKDIVLLINKAGYLKAQQDGTIKDIELELAPDSYVPDDNFVKTLYNEVKVVVKDTKIPANVKGVNNSDYYDNSNYQLASEVTTQPAVTAPDTTKQKKQTKKSTTSNNNTKKNKPVYHHTDYSDTNYTNYTDYKKTKKKEKKSKKTTPKHTDYSDYNTDYNHHTDYGDSDYY